MAQDIVKNVAVTRVTYALTTMENGELSCQQMPMAVFRGILSKERVLKKLREKHGVDAAITIINLDASQHRFVMQFEDFIAAAKVCDLPAPEDSGAAEQAAEVPGEAEVPDAPPEIVGTTPDTADQSTSETLEIGPETGAIAATEADAGDLANSVYTTGTLEHADGIVEFEEDD